MAFPRAVAAHGVQGFHEVHGVHEELADGVGPQKALVEERGREGHLEGQEEDLEAGPSRAVVALHQGKAEHLPWHHMGRFENYRLFIHLTKLASLTLEAPCWTHIIEEGPPCFSGVSVLGSSLNHSSEPSNLGMLQERQFGA